MERFTILKNKGELFKCQLQVEGAEIEDTTVRLCLEFDDNKNMYFYGHLEEDGVCSIKIPPLENIEKEIGKLTIEVVADSTFFKLYECEVDFKHSVDVNMTHKETTSRPAQKVKLASNIVQERTQEVTESIKSGNKENKAPQNKSGLPKFRDYYTNRKK